MDVTNLSAKAREALAKIQARNERRRMGILRGEESREFQEYIDRLYAERYASLERRKAA